MKNEYEKSTVRYIKNDGDHYHIYIGPVELGNMHRGQIRHLIDQLDKI